MIIEKEETNYLKNDSFCPELKEMFITWTSGELFAKDYYKKMVDFWHSKGIYQLDHIKTFAECSTTCILKQNCLSINIPYPEDEDNDWKDMFDPIKDAFNFEMERLNEAYEIVDKAQELKDWNAYNVGLHLVQCQVRNVNTMRTLNQIISSELSTDTIIKELSKQIPSHCSIC